MVKEAWADVDVQLERRHDLIPSLVNFLKMLLLHLQILNSLIFFKKKSRLKINKFSLSRITKVKGSNFIW
jgi:hypothetical protein